jgi:hypothetical protein
MEHTCGPAMGNLVHQAGEVDKELAQNSQESVDVCERTLNSQRLQRV